MLYNQPYGITDTNAAYINGNPSTGTMGSIPPASAIEFDQREIVAVIQYAANLGLIDYANQVCQQPSNADLQQLLKAIYGMINVNKLTTPKTYYVNTSTGNDTFDGLTPTTAFQTIQRAVNQASIYNLNGFNITINVADGTYGQVSLPAINGTGLIALYGNLSIPGNCIIHANQGPALKFIGGPYLVAGFRLEADTSDPVGGYPAAGMWVGNMSSVQVNINNSAMEFGFCNDMHMSASGGVIAIDGGTTIRICGNAKWHLYSAGGATIYCGNIPVFPTLVIPAAQTVQSFALATQTGNLNVVYNSISGKTNITGQTYSAGLNGVINTNGAGANYYPGTVAGAVGSGGQYV